MSKLNNIFFVFIFLIISLCGHAQSDSLLLIKTNWNKETIDSGIVYYSYHFKDSSLFNSNQYIHILEISPNRQISIVPSPILIETSTLSKEIGAKASINGSFFKFVAGHNYEDYNSVDYIRLDNTVLAPNTYTNNSRAFHQLGAFAIFNNNYYILKADCVKDWEKYIRADHIITSGPLLIIDREAQSLKNHTFYTTRHPRTALAIDKENNILFITVDGRAKEANGMSLEELMNTFRWLGVKSLLNLDGGGSTTMYISGKGVVNHPTDNRLFDNNGERKVANIISVK